MQIVIYCTQYSREKYNFVYFLIRNKIIIYYYQSRFFFFFLLLYLSKVSNNLAVRFLCRIKRNNSIEIYIKRKKKKVSYCGDGNLILSSPPPNVSAGNDHIN